MEKKQKKEDMQETLDVESYIATLEKQIDKGFKGQIIDTKPVTNTIYFKGGGSFDERNGVAVSVLVDDKDKTEFNNWFGLPNVRGYEKSNMYAFKRKYGSVPKVGLEVEVVIDDNGFFKIRY